MQAVVRKAYEDPRQVAASDSSDGFRLAYSHRRAVEYRVDTGVVSFVLVLAFRPVFVAVAGVAAARPR